MNEASDPSPEKPETLEDYIVRTVGVKNALLHYCNWQQNLSAKYDRYEDQKKNIRKFLDRYDPDRTSGIDEEILSAGLQFLQERILLQLKPIEDVIDRLKEQAQRENVKLINHNS